jgi:hypothetical protein
MGFSIKRLSKRKILIQSGGEAMLEGILGIVAGLLLLLAGRRFFWLAAALVAFLFAWNLVAALFGGGWLALVIGVVAGVVFAWLATRFIKIVAYFLAFFAGAVGLPYLVGLFGINMSWLLLALIGGVLGLVLIAFAFDWGLILLTAWAGASAVSNGLQNWLSLGSSIATVIFLVLLVVGVVVQASQMRKT